MRVCLVAKVLDDQGDLKGAYCKYVELPFIPSVGMKFKQGNSTWLWEYYEGELEPEVKEVVYNFDEETIFCLFEIDQFLKSSFWTEITNLRNSLELHQFTIHN